MQRDSITGILRTRDRISAGLSVGGGVTSYNELVDLPTMNGHIIEGDMTPADLDIWQPKNFSTTEQNTGVKWIDGKDIYTITIDNINDNNRHDVSFLDISEIINAQFFFVTADQYYYGNINAGSGYTALCQYDNDEKAILYRVNGWSATKRVITIYYTKVGE